LKQDEKNGNQTAKELHIQRDRFFSASIFALDLLYF
jgi:hypothetical protein